jgi:hypothetical protein
MARLAVGFTWYRDEAGYRIASADESVENRTRSTETETFLRSIGRNPRPTTTLDTYQKREYGEFFKRFPHVPVPLPFRKSPRIYFYLTNMEEQLDDRHPISRSWTRSPVIKREGGRLVGYEPLDKFPLLFSQFASISKNKEGVLDFMQKFGPLTKDGLDPLIGENVEYLLDAARAMEMIINPASPPVIGFNLGRLVAKFEFVDGAVRLKLDAQELLNALWLQCAQHLSNGANLRQCKQCNTWFEVGLGTGRRLDAKFCSDEHRVLFNSRRRSERMAS